MQENRNEGGRCSWAGILCVAALAMPLVWAGCAAMDDGDTPRVSKGNYMDEGATILVDDPYYTRDEEGLTLLEERKRLSESLDVECEKNALLNQQLLAMREARDQLKKAFDETRSDLVRLNGRIASLQVDLAGRERRIDEIIRENRDILENFVNLKLEKNKVEKELLKIKIAALAGDG